jgi:membrane fusion protein, multidrug efflux system
LNLTYSRITAPIAGRVGLRLVDAGNVVSASSTTGLVVITQVEPIAVVFTLPEDALRTVLPRIRAGARLPVEAFDRSGATRLATGSVQTIDNQIDQATGTIRVKAVFDNRDSALFPAQFVNVRMLADTRRCSKAHKDSLSISCGTARWWPRPLPWASSKPNAPPSSAD